MCEHKRVAKLQTNLDLGIATSRIECVLEQLPNPPSLVFRLEILLSFQLLVNSLSSILPENVPLVRIPLLSVQNHGSSYSFVASRLYDSRSASSSTPSVPKIRRQSSHDLSFDSASASFQPLRIGLRFARTSLILTMPISIYNRAEVPTIIVTCCRCVSILLPKLVVGVHRSIYGTLVVRADGGQLNSAPLPDDHGNSLDFREKTTFPAFTFVGQRFRDAAPCSQLAFKSFFFEFLPIIHAVNRASQNSILDFKNTA